MWDENLDRAVVLPILAPDECEDVRAAVHEMRAAWRQRHPALPFYTLGAASYMDAAEDKPAYYEGARRDNPTLRARFGALYQRIAQAIAGHLGGEVVLRDDFALPGFHIFLSDPAFAQPLASIHRDLQYRLLDWRPEEEADFEHPISFTLPLRLPARGGGMFLWDLYHHEIEGLSQTEMARLIRSRPRRFFPYEVGKMVLASGHRVHQIAPYKEPSPDDERITLQGHGIRTRAGWNLYW
ncbi:MAG: hypothetical protein QM820_44320 [Minicystis sp.]